MSNSVIDVHTHVYPRVYIESLVRREELPLVERRGEEEYFVIFPGEAGRLLNANYWSVEEKLEYMERSGISQSVVSLGNPWLQPFARDEARGLAKDLNAELASLQHRTAGKIVAMGCVPEGDIDDVLLTVEEVASTDGLYGIVAGTSLCGRRFDDPALERVWETLAGTKTPLLVHPHHGLGLSEMEGFGHALPLALGFPFETTTALSRLTMSGVLDRHPDLRVIGSHGGGALPYLAGRLDGCWSPDEEARGRNDSEPSTGAGRLYLDALVYHPRALRAAADLVGTNKMMFGTDHPFAIADPQVNITSISDAFDLEDSSRVFSETARFLFELPDVKEEA